MYGVKVEKKSHDARDPSSGICSWLIRFPRVVLAETVTHRMNYQDGEISFTARTTTPNESKNSASSRAVPVRRMMKNVRENPYVPRPFTVNEAGMQGHSCLSGDDQAAAEKVWCQVRDAAVSGAEELERLGVHKQDANRLVEPFVWMTQLVTTTRPDNFFALRCDEMAHPAFRQVARMMYLAWRASPSEPLRPGEWHLPFVPTGDVRPLPWLPTDQSGRFPDVLKFSAARCAWLSYENHEKDGTPEQMLSTYDRLVGGKLKHASPLEHQATPMPDGWEKAYPGYASNLRGWLQMRKILPDEAVAKYAPSDAEVASWGITGPLWSDV